MESLKFFKFSFLLTFLGFALAFLIGGPQALFIIIVLSIMEISLSFDNAVVNANVLKDMDEKWQKRFLTWGILIAVFGMRIVFPILVVCVVAGISPIAAIDIAINDQEQYSLYMIQENAPLMGFGSGFLMLVGLTFFFDHEKDFHWIKPIESRLAFLGKSKLLPIIITFLLMFILATIGLSGDEFKKFMVAGAIGIIVHECIGKLSGWMEKREEEREKAAKLANSVVAKSGFAMFMYLEVLDASFSFDGVIGAFAITTDIFLIAIGLGIGAMFVRSLTIMLVRKGTLTEYKYLEHGAFYAIIALAIIMMLKSFYHVPEVVTGLIGVGFIGAAFLYSLKSRDDFEDGNDDESGEDHHATKEQYKDSFMRDLKVAHPNSTDEELENLYKNANREV